LDSARFQVHKTAKANKLLEITKRVFWQIVSIGVLFDNTLLLIFVKRIYIKIQNISINGLRTAQ
jgi:hypothetical protein